MPVSATTVSYTHLPRFLQEDIWSQELSGIDCRTGTLWLGILWTVSYTHLDVYKRQLHVIGDAMGIVIIKLEDKARQIILFIQRFNQFLTDKMCIRDSP